MIICLAILTEYWCVTDIQTQQILCNHSSHGKNWWVTSTQSLRRRRAWVQIATAMLSGNSLRQTVHTHRASVHEAAKLVVRVARVTAGLTHVTCRLTAKNRDQLRNPMLGNRVWATFTFYNSIKGSPYSITERRVAELIPVLGSQPAGDVSHKPSGRLPLLSARPAVTPTTP